MTTVAAQQFDAALDARAAKQAQFEAARLRLAVEAGIYASQKHGIGTEPAMRLGTLFAEAAVDHSVGQLKKLGASHGQATAAIGECLAKAEQRAFLLQQVCAEIDKSKMEFDAKKRVEAEARAGITRSGISTPNGVYSTPEMG